MAGWRVVTFVGQRAAECPEMHDNSLDENVIREAVKLMFVAKKTHRLSARKMLVVPIRDATKKKKEKKKDATKECRRQARIVIHKPVHN